MNFRWQAHGIPVNQPNNFEISRKLNNRVILPRNSGPQNHIGR
jgi:hypothetical protein